MNEFGDFTKDRLKEWIGQPIKGCPSAVGNWLAGVPVDISDEGITIEFEVREDMCNPYGTLHGGMIATMIDEVVGVTVYIMDTPTVYVAADLNVDFLSPGRKGETLTVKSKIIRKGILLIFLETEVINKRNKLVAKGKSKMIDTKQKR